MYATFPSRKAGQGPIHIGRYLHVLQSDSIEKIVFLRSVGISHQTIRRSQLAITNLRSFL